MDNVAGHQRSKWMAFVLAAMTIGLAILAVFQFYSISDLHRQNEKLKAALDSNTAKEIADARVACSARSAAVFAGMGYTDKGDGGKTGADSQTYTNHYNPVLKRCIMEVTVTTIMTGMGTATESIARNIFDADERTDFGTYVWISSPTKKYYEQPPFECSMSPPGKSTATCRSHDEWERYVHSLMS